MDSQSPSFKPGLVDRALVSIFHLVNKSVPWHKLPSLIGAINLDARTTCTMGTPRAQCRAIQLMNL
jgi:hypothetical protein